MMRDQLQRKFECFVQEVKSLPRPALLLAAGVVAAVSLATLLAVSSVLGYWAEGAAQVSDIQPRMARLQGYIESQEQFTQAANQSAAMAGSLMFKDSGGSGRGGALLQQTVRQLAEKAGLTITGSELRESVPLDNLAKMLVNLTLTGDPDDVMQFLRLVNRNRPVLFVESIQLSDVYRRARSRRNAPEQSDIQADVLVSAYRLASGSEGAEEVGDD